MISKFEWNEKGMLSSFHDHYGAALLHQTSRWPHLSGQKLLKAHKSLYTVALEGHKPTRSLSSMQLMMPALYCRWLVTRWRLWTWPPYSGRTCCTSRRAQRRSSAWRARREWRTAPLSSAWCSSWSTRTSPCSRYVTHITLHLIISRSHLQMRTIEEAVKTSNDTQAL